ncbi:MAG: DUF1801 domain-containing protein [Vallitaleaceae bacterium]|jgi:uncharacterized protein YdhG (YjbR/CyaY superfamily)|nr:DUF1801 domain-containing protein [Vallitaleaceae bacterium]
MIEVFAWIGETFSELEAAIKWNQPMFMNHGTFIIGFSMAKQHMAFTPEEAGIAVFLDDIKKSGYEHTKMLAKIKWTDEVDYNLLHRMIEFNIADKLGCTTFFR